MKTVKISKLPKWVIKEFQHESEDKDLSSAIVGLSVLYLMGICFLFISRPFGHGYLIAEIISAIILLVILIGFIFWLTAKVTLLSSLRKEALIRMKNAKTEAEIDAARMRLLKLSIPIPL